MVKKNIIIIIIIIFFILFYLVKHTEIFFSKQNFVEVQYLNKPRKLEIKLISMPSDKWKRDRFNQSMTKNNQFFNYNIWDGILLREKPYLLDWAIKNKYSCVPKQMKAKGNIGSALAHITLWDYIAKQHNNVSFLVFEDNVLATNKSWKIIEKVKKINYDFINLRVLRPRGKKTNIPNLLEYNKIKIRELFPNVWLSSYLITPRGAKLFLQNLKKYQYDLSINIIDRIVTQFLHTDTNIKAYIIDSDEYFGHIETSNDTRRKENS
jgi:GR25 family glycosyltransferase involved in LPS biosynthesis